MTATPHLCSQPWCPNIIDGTGYCHEHRRAGTARGTPGYGTRSWRRVRDAYIAAHPVCEGCRRAPATEVHHRDHRHPSAPGANAWTNLMALCHPCHAKLTGKRRREKRRALAA